LNSPQQGQSLNLGLFVTDVQHYAITDAIVNVTIGDLSTIASSLGQGWYAVNLTSDQTQNLLGDIEITIKIEKTGYDPLSTSISMRVGSSLFPEWLEPYLPFILLGIIGVVAIYFGTRSSKKKKKVIPIPSLDNHRKISRPRKLKIPIPEETPESVIPRSNVQMEDSASGDQDDIFASPSRRQMEELQATGVPSNLKCPICGSIMKVNDTMCDVCGYTVK
jgi:hypothetical protein